MLDSGKTLHDYPGFQFVKDNVERAIPDLVHWLQGTTEKYDDDDDDNDNDDDDDDGPDDDVILKQAVKSYRDGFVYKDVMHFAG